MRGQYINKILHLLLVFLSACAGSQKFEKNHETSEGNARSPSSISSTYRFKSTITGNNEKDALTLFKEGKKLGLYWKKTGTRLEIDLALNPRKIWWQQNIDSAKDAAEESQNDFSKYTEQAIPLIDHWLRNISSLKISEDEYSIPEIELSLLLIKDYLSHGSTEGVTSVIEKLQGSKFPHPFETQFSFQGNSPFNHQNESYQLTLKTESTCEAELHNKTLQRIYRVNICHSIIRLRTNSKVRTEYFYLRKYSPWDDLNFDIESKLIQKISFHMEWQDRNTLSPLNHSLRLISQYLVADQVYSADEDEIRPDLSPFTPFQRPHAKTYQKIHKLIKNKLRPHAKKACIKAKSSNLKACQVKKCFTGLYNYVYPEHSLWKKISIPERRKKVHELSQLMHQHLKFKSKYSPITNMCKARHEPERLHPLLSPEIIECIVAQEVELSYEPNAINYTACMPECPGGKQCSTAHGLGQQTLNTFLAMRKTGLLPLSNQQYLNMKDHKIFEMMNDDLSLQFEVMFLHMNYLLKFHSCRDPKLKGEKLILDAVETYDQDAKSRYLKNFRSCYQCMKKFKPGMNLKECYR